MASARAEAVPRMDTQPPHGLMDDAGVDVLNGGFARRRVLVQGELADDAPRVHRAETAVLIDDTVAFMQFSPVHDEPRVVAVVDAHCTSRSELDGDTARRSVAATTDASVTNPSGTARAAVITHNPTRRNGRPPFQPVIRKSSFHLEPSSQWCSPSR